MRIFRHLALLLALFAPLALADGQYQVELIIFRQAGDPVPASQPAPDDWASGAQSIAGSERATALDGAAAKLNPNNGYQVLLHKAWTQNLSSVPSKVAVSTGDQQFGHFPVEGTVSLSQERVAEANLDFWINRFDADGLLTSSERLKQSARLKNGELNYLDHSNLGVLIKIVPM
ncbi:CsiV family protein [Zestomonas carbonaria]|uniref:Peptidoglycan-binding protein, CsiV n=1 Tax=Zestomonas carbonaria TaxID=2762745 RepID=A0A7U7IBE2_9GAMM|nr:CsiV family protein [Pseudomonas carbonaria]CAD5108822.1 hypothetical protein PSEWESI4_03114 [Pseudomonas carbonaria]